MKKLVFLSVFLSTAAYGQNAGPSRIDPNAVQYAQSCSLGPMNIITFSAAARAKQVQNISTGQNQLFRLGEQIAVKCTAAGRVTICAHQTYTATVGTPGTNLAGWTASDTLTAQGYLPCGEITIANPIEYFKISPLRWAGSIYTTPTLRMGFCSVPGTGRALAAPCGTSAECGSGGTCSFTARSPYVYISLIPESAASVCSVQLCEQ